MRFSATLKESLEILLVLLLVREGKQSKESQKHFVLYS